MTKNYSTEIAGVMKQHFEKYEIDYQYNEDSRLFRFELNIGGKARKIDFAVSIDESDLTFYGLSPLDADADDENMMKQISAFLHKVNYNLKYGCFELDPDDGEIRLKCFIDCEGQLPNDTMIAASIFFITAMYLRFFEGIVSIIYGGVSADTAYRMCQEEEPVQRRAASAVRRKTKLRAARASSSGTSEAAETPAPAAPKIRMNLFGEGGED